MRQTCRAEFRSLTAVRPAIILVRGGYKIARVGDRTLTLRTGRIGVLPAHRSLHIENVPDGGRYVASILLPSESPLRSRHLPPGDPFLTTNDDRTLAAFERAAHALDDPCMPDSLKEHAVEEVLLWLADGGIGFGPDRPLRFVDKLRSVLASRPDFPWVAAGVAGEMAISEATLKRRLSAAGTTFADILADVRMTHALGLLHTSELPINRVALEVGYASPSKFAARFRARFGIPPSAIRKEAGEGRLSARRPDIPGTEGAPD